MNSVQLATTTGIESEPASAVNEALVPTQALRHPRIPVATPPAPGISCQPSYLISSLPAERPGAVSGKGEDHRGRMQKIGLPLLAALGLAGHQMTMG